MRSSATEPVEEVESPAQKCHIYQTQNLDGWLGASGLSFLNQSLHFVIV